MKHALLSGLLILFIAGSLIAQLTVDDFEGRSYSLDIYDMTLNYRLFIPDNYDKEHSYPLVLFLHGASARGNDNRAHLTTGAYVWASPENQAVNPCFVLAPQCREGRTWSNFGSPDPSTPMQMVLDVIDSLLLEFNIDPDQLHVNGFSMGGFGTLDVLAKRPDMFASGMPIAGGGDIRLAAEISTTPLWIFHSDDDGVVPVENSRSMYAALKNTGMVNVIYTEYTGFGHGGWNTAYAEPLLQNWIFAQNNGMPAPQPPLSPVNLSAESFDKWEMDLSWEMPVEAVYPEKGAFYYDIFRDGVKIDTSTTLFYKDIGLNEAETYNYEIRAVNYYLLNSEKSVMLTATTMTDVTPPTIETYEVIDNQDGSAIIEIEFSEVMDQVSVSDVNNYTISSGMKALSAVIDETNRHVNIMTPPLTSDTPYTLTVNGLKDQAKGENLIAPNKQLEFILPEWLTTDIGEAVTAGTLAINNDEFIITGSGKNVTAWEDEFTYARKNINDHASISTTIASLEANHDQAGAGIMFRETIDVSSQLVGVYVSKLGDIMFISRSGENGLAKRSLVSRNAALPIQFKIERMGNQFRLYQSSDGINWGDELKNITVEMNSKIKSGLFLFSFDQSVCKASFNHVEINDDLHTSVVNPNLKPIPESFKIMSAYPNPFNPVVNIVVSINTKTKLSDSPVQLKIINTMGQTVYQTPLKNSPGIYTWNGIDQYGIPQSSGIYFAGIENGKQRDYKKIMLVQ